MDYALRVKVLDAFYHFFEDYSDFLLRQLEVHGVDCFKELAEVHFHVLEHDQCLFYFFLSTVFK